MFEEKTPKCANSNRTSVSPKLLKQGIMVRGGFQIPQRECVMVEVHLSGVFPRSESLVEITRAADRGRATDADVQAALECDCQALLQLQTQIGVDYVVDGQLNWQDMFRPFTELFTGIQLGSLTRWFDNNTFYRKPIIVEKVKPHGDNVDQFFRHKLLLDIQRKKAIVPGPLTFALLSENKAYGNVADLIDDLSHALSNVIATLRETGYSLIQFNEPAISNDKRANEVLQYAKQSYETCAQTAGAKTALHLYFSDPEPVLDALLDLPVDAVGIDFYATSLESIAKHTFNKELDCGCIDGRNSLLESPEDLSKFVQRVKQKVEPKHITVTPNCDLDFLPYPVAEKKTRLLTEVKKRLG
jgi:5-methyltetrahydropteroyltriglutamate--homocysteine methyltransferase